MAGFRKKAPRGSPGGCPHKVGNRRPDQDLALTPKAKLERQLHEAMCTLFSPVGPTRGAGQDLYSTPDHGDHM